MRIRHAAWVIGVLVLLDGHRAGARPALDPAGLGRLARYDVLTFTDPGGGGIEKSKAIAVFDATPDEVFRTATDYARLAEFAPRVVSSTVVTRQGDTHAFVMLTSDLPWPVSKAWVYAEFLHEKLPGDVYRVRFWQVRGSMRRYFGSILIEPWPETKSDPRFDPKSSPKSSVTYELLAEPDSIAPRRLVNSKLRDAATRYVHALRQRINELHRLGRLHPQQPPMPDLPSALAGARKPVVVEEVANRSR